MTEARLKPSSSALKATTPPPKPTTSAAAGTWNEHHAQRITEAITRSGLNTTPLISGNIDRYARLLLKWNRTYNLLGATTADALLDDHLLDTISILPTLTHWLNSRPPGRLHDVGSGAGLPGIPIAIVLSDLPITLIEPIGKKAAFLRQVAAECRLSNVRVIEGRIESLATTTGEGTPHFICRAFTALARFCDYCLPHASNHSLLFAMKARQARDEIESLPASVQLVADERLDPAVPGTERHLIVLSRRTDTAATNPT